MRPVAPRYLGALEKSFRLRALANHSDCVSCVNTSMLWAILIASMLAATPNFEELHSWAPPVHDPPWRSLQITAVAPVPAWSHAGLRPGDIVRLFNGHVLDATGQKQFFAWSVSEPTPAQFVVKRGSKIVYLKTPSPQAHDIKFRPWLVNGRLEGLTITSLPPETNSDGLKVGDRIVAVNGKRFDGSVAWLLALFPAAQTITVERGGHEWTWSPRAFTRPADVPSSSARTPR